MNEGLRKNTTQLLGDILLRLGAETRENMHRDIHPHREKAIHASFGGENCVARILDARRNFKLQRGVFGICCIGVHQVARECSKDKPFSVNDDAELLVPSPLRSQTRTVRRDPSSALSRPSSNPGGAKPRARTS